MRKGVRASTIAVLSLAVSGFGLAGCGLKEPPPFDPLDAQRDAREAALRNNKPAPMYELPTTLQDLTTQPDTPPADPNAPITQPANPHVHLRPGNPQAGGPSINENHVVRMTLQSIIQRSVAHSADVKVAGFDAAIAKTKILEAEGKLDPVFFINAKYEHQDTPFAGQAIQNPLNPTGVPLTLFVERGEVYTLEPGIKADLATGGQIALSYQFQYNYLLPQRFVLNPYWDDQLKFQITQPLLRNAGVEVNEARITIARNDTRVAVLDFRKALEDNVAELEKDYWQLQEAEQEVKIQENLLKTTRDTAQILFKQFANGGAVSRVQTSQAQASIRDREAVLVRAYAKLGDVSDDIKRRMNDPEFPVASPIRIMPLDVPAEDRLQFDVADQVSTALANRLELGEQDLKIKDAEVALNVALNNAYPKLDLTSAITLEGIAAPDHKKSLTGEAGNFGNTFHTQWESDGHLGWSLGLAFELPIGNHEARAIIRRAYLQRLQAISQYHNQMDQVTLDVTTAIREVQTTWNEIAARRQARFAQADQLAAYEDKRINGEPLTPTFVQLVLDAQERLADSEREEALAVASYQVAIARMERAKGMLLRYNNVVLAEDQFKGMDR